MVAASVLVGCYTDPINMRPNVSIAPPSEPIFRGAPAPFTATASDPDGDAPFFAWATTDGECQPGLPENAWPTQWEPGTMTSTTSSSFLVDQAPALTFCVWVKAFDQYGAANVAALTCKPLDNPPMARITVTAPPDAASFPLHTSFELSGATSSDADNDTLTDTWQVISSPDPMLDVTACASGPTCAFKADVSGSYDVQLKVSDGTDISMISKTLLVSPGQVPQAMLERVSPTGPGPYPLGTSFKLSSALSMGGDAANALKPLWQPLNHDGAPGSTASLIPCPDSPTMDDVRCFTADKPGTYGVQLAVMNDTTSPLTTLTLEVLDDQAPCIGMTTPPIPPTPTSTVPASAMLGTMFTVMTVLDDLDSLPKAAPPADPSAQNLFGLPHYQWFVSDPLDPTAALMPTWVDSPMFPIDPGMYELGQQVRVRLQISDVDTGRSAKEFAACTDDSCFTGAQTDGCFQRVTWTVGFTL